MWIIFGILSCFFSALMSFFIKIGLKDTNPILNLFLRTFIVIIILGFYFIIKSLNKEFTSEINKLTSKQMKWIILSGVATLLTWVFYFLAMSKSEAYKVMALDKLSIVFGLLLSYLFLDYKITLYSFIGVVLVVLGTVVLLIS